MRVLFFINNVSKTRHFDSVIAMLVERGHNVVLAAARQRNRPLALPKNLLHATDEFIARGLPGRIELTTCPVNRVDRWRALAPAIRQARDYLRFFDERYADAEKLERRSATSTPKGWLRFIEEHPWLSKHWRFVSVLLALVERAIPSDKLFDLFIAYERPDVVLVTPLVDYGSYQTDYVKSAHRLGIPVVFMPFSWDNLTNRGLIRVTPDRVLVWNDIQKSETTDLHGVPADRVTITGAPRFDAFFAMRPSVDRESFCRRTGLDPSRPFLLYLCSSEFVAPREVEFVSRWITYLHEHKDPAVRGCGVLVRPHPAHLKQWKGVDLSSFSNVALWHEKETMNADQGLYDSLYYSSAVVGLNTSAMLEAAILDRPVLTLVLEEFAEGQQGTLHFHYLRASNGGLLHEATSFREHATQVSEALEGRLSAEQRRRFVERFVRPRGWNEPVTPIMVGEIEKAATLSKRPQRPALWHFAVRLCLRLGLGAYRLAAKR